MLRKLLLAGLLLSATNVFAQRVPKEWVDRYNGICRMLERRDITSFQALFDPSFVLIDPKGVKQTREEFFANVDHAFKGASKVDCKMYVTRVNQRGPRVDVAFEMKLNIRRKNHSTVVIHEIGVDSWKQFNHKWYLVKTVDKTLNYRETKPGRRGN